MFRTTVWQDFGSFRNTFAVDRPYPDNVKTTDSHGNLVAEAHVVNLVKGEGYEIEETHYSAGKKIFTARSFVSLDGYKESEKSTQGTKERDYFFVWPSH